MCECWDVQDVTGPWIHIHTCDGGGGGIDTVTVTALPYGAEPSAVLSGSVLTLSLPAGAPGEQGERSADGADGPPGEKGDPPETLTVASLDDAIGLPAGTWILVAG